ncbi:MAG: nucleotidyltransferase domain-containing protein [Armatimonadota bacterium]
MRRVVAAYARLVADEFPDSQIVLFGSYVRGEAHDGSDIDVAVIVPEIRGDYLALAARLCRLRDDLDPLIEPHLLSRENDDSGFVREVLRTGEVIHQVA